MACPCGHIPGLFSLSPPGRRSGGEIRICGRLLRRPKKPLLRPSPAGRGEETCDEFPVYQQEMERVRIFADTFRLQDTQNLRRFPNDPLSPIRRSD